MFEQLGVRPLINAATSLTALGGSLMPPEVMDAMQSASSAFVDMVDLHLAAGEELARLTQNEAAYVTPGCAAGIVLSVLACRTRGDLARVGRLPTHPSLPSEVIMHTAHRIPYDPAVLLAGARIREVGNVLKTFPWELDASISDDTAAVLYVAGSHLQRGALPLRLVVDIAHSHGVPVIVDAAAQLPPVENLWRFTRDEGADIAVFSGGKSLRGPQSSGLMVGRRSLIDAAIENGSPHQRYGRAMKVGKEEITGLVAAVGRYLALDHQAEHSRWYGICRGWEAALSGFDDVAVTLEDRNSSGQPVPRVRVAFNGSRDPGRALSLVQRLRNGDPGIAVLPGAFEDFYLGPEFLAGDQADTVIARVVEELRTCELASQPASGPFDALA